MPPGFSGRTLKGVVSAAMMGGVLEPSPVIHRKANHKRVVATTNTMATRIKGTGDWRSCHSSSSLSSGSRLSQKDKSEIFCEPDRGFPYGDSA